MKSIHSKNFSNFSFSPSIAVCLFQFKYFCNSTTHHPNIFIPAS